MTYLNKFDPIKGIETRTLMPEVLEHLLTYLNKFDPIKGIETVLAATVAAAPLNLNKFDPIKGIETLLSQLHIILLLLI